MGQTETDGQMDGRIAALLNATVGGGIILINNDVIDSYVVCGS